MTAEDTTIAVRNVGIRYNLRMRGRTTLHRFVVDRMTRTARDPGDQFWAIRGVSLTACAGDVIGVVGINGAGKSTLLASIAGLLRPDEGVVQTFGRRVTLLTLGAGFDQNLTGRENVFLSAAFLGISKREVSERLGQIIRFSGIGRFIDVPVRQYSSGMKARLGFSVVAHLNPEILLLDEVMGVGDAGFRDRSTEKLNELMADAATMIIVSHSASFVAKTCKKVLWLSHGRGVAFGPTEEVLEEYAAATRDQTTAVRSIY